MAWGKVLHFAVHCLAISLALPGVCSAAPPDEFLQNRPGFRLTQALPYQVYSDEPDGEVRQLIGTLTNLQREFEEHFNSLLVQHGTPRTIEVLYFGQAADFEEYTARIAPALAGSAGFYCSQNNRLVLASQRVLASRPVVGRVAPPLPVPGGHYLPAVRHVAPTEARRMAERVIRHEGAHQLFSQYHLHSEFALEPTWITEGLAEYCVPDRIGAPHPVYVEALRRARRAGTLLPLEALLNQRDPHGFFALGERSTELAYAQSWGLVWLLMQDRYRERFLRLLQAYRDTDARCARAMEDVEPLHLLLDHLGVDFATFENDWNRFLGSLPATIPPVRAAENDG